MTMVEAENSSILDTPVEQLRLPTRMGNFAEAKGLRTLRDLVMRHPTELLMERNLGRKSIRDTRAAIEPLLGMSWEEASTGAPVDGPGSEAGPAASREPWDALEATLPEAALQRSLDDTTLPARLRSFAEARGLRTVRELVHVRAAELRTSPNMGRGTLRDGAAALARLATSEDRQVRAAEWRAILLRGLATLPMRERMVLTQRSGVAGPIPTLAELGVSLGVSRERIRQLEQRGAEELRRGSADVLGLATALAGIAPAFVERLDRVVEEGVAIVNRVEDDVPPLAFLLTTVLPESGIHTFEHDGTAYFGKATESIFLEKLGTLQRVCEGLVFPLERAGLEDRLRAGARLTADEMPVLFELVRGAFTEEAGRVVGYGTKRDDTIIAFLRAHGRPLHVSQAVAAVGGRCRMPDEVIWVDRGMVTLPELVPDFLTWRARLGPVVTMLIAEHGEDRQWTTAELLPLLGTVADLPEWMNQHALGSLLKDAPGIAYLGRNVVTLTSAGTGDRSYVLDVVEGVLDGAGAPLTEADLKERVRETRGLSDLTWSMLRMKPPFLLLDGGRVGLAPRDVPGGIAATKAFTDAAFGWLEGRERGVIARELADFVRTQPGPICDWDIRLTRSVLRHDGRFRQAHGGGLGLAAWGETRARTQRQAVEQVLAGRDRVPLDEVIAAVPTVSGDPIPKERLALLVKECGAKLTQGFVVRDAPLRPVPLEPQSWAMCVPERSAATFEHYLRDARPAAALRDALVDWHAALLDSDSWAIDRDQVRDLFGRAMRLLEKAPEAPEVRAAVEYLVCVSDAESDLVVGGLDDDAAVLAVVEAAQGSAA